MIGLGIRHSRRFTSAGEAEAWWRDMVGRTESTTDAALAGEPMAGPVAFVSFPFAIGGEHVVVVPEVVIGRRAGRSWVTTWDAGGSAWGRAADADSDSAPIRVAVNTPVTAADALTSPAGPPAGTGGNPIEFETGPMDHARWLATVERARARIRAGEAGKVVLARAETGRAAGVINKSRVLSRLAAAYPDTWTFCVANLIGATPELLIRADRGRITSRVLAGTIPGIGTEAALVAALSSSSKDLEEHEYAVASVAAALDGHATALEVPTAPFVLRLPNVMHLATDITGTARDGATVLELAGAIHPSAAVCGTPTEPARAMIEELEGLDRGRYAGPVGWINASGDGEIALALRCGLIEDDHATIYAGCGIVADSDPEAEWTESIAKLLPMKHALT